MKRNNVRFMAYFSDYLARADIFKDMGIPEWHRFVELASSHGTGQLLYYNLHEKVNPVPSEVIERLREQYYQNAVKNEFFYDELGRILGTLKDLKYGVIVMKGAALAEIVYRDRALRPFNDIDLLIRKEDLNNASDAISSIGYKLDDHATPRKFSEKYDYHLRYLKGACIIELHWDIGIKTGIYKYMKIDLDALWKNAIRSRISGTYALVPSPEDLMILCCIHLAKHKYSRLIWLYDIRQIAGSYPVNWEHLVLKAKASSTSKPVFYSLSLAKDFAGLTLPEKVMFRLRPGTPEIKIFRFLLSHEQFNKLNIINDMILRLLLIDRPIDRIRMIMTFPAESLTYLLFGNKRKILRRLKEGNSGL